MWLDSGLEAVRSFVAAHVLDAPSSAMRRRAPTSSRPSRIQERASGTGAGAQVAATALHGYAEHGRSTPNVHGRGARGQGFHRTGRRPHQENRRAEAARGVYERLRQEASPDSPPPNPTREPACQHDRLHEPGGIANIAKSEAHFWWYGACGPSCSACWIPAWPEEHRPRPRSRVRHGLLRAPA